MWDDQKHIKLSSVPIVTSWKILDCCNASENYGNAFRHCYQIETGYNDTRLTDGIHDDSYYEKRNYTIPSYRHRWSEFCHNFAEPCILKLCKDNLIFSIHPRYSATNDYRDPKLNLCTRNALITILDERVTTSIIMQVMPHLFLRNHRLMSNCIEVESDAEKNCIDFSTNQHSYPSVALPIWSCDKQQPSDKIKIHKKIAPVVKFAHEDCSGIGVIKQKRCVNNLKCSRRRGADRLPAERCRTSHAQRTETNVAPFAAASTSLLLRCCVYTLIMLNISEVYSKSIYNPYEYSIKRDLLSDRKVMKSDGGWLFPNKLGLGHHPVDRMYPSVGRDERSHERLSPRSYDDVIPNDTSSGRLMSERKSPTETVITRDRKYCGKYSCNLHQSTREISADYPESHRNHSSLILNKNWIKIFTLKTINGDLHIKNDSMVTNRTIESINEIKNIYDDKMLDEIKSKFSPPIRKRDGSNEPVVKKNRPKYFPATVITKFSESYEDISLPSAFIDQNVISAHHSVQRRSLLDEVFKNVNKKDLIKLAGLVTEIVHLINLARFRESDLKSEPSNRLWPNHADHPGVVEARHTETDSPATWIHRPDKGKQEDQTTNSGYSKENFVGNREGNRTHAKDAENADQNHSEKFKMTKHKYSSWNDNPPSNHFNGGPKGHHKGGALRSISTEEGRQLFGLGFFTGTVINFLRDPVVLFLVFWFNVSTLRKKNYDHVFYIHMHIKTKC